MTKNVKVRGIDELLKKLQNIQKNIREMEKKDIKVPFVELFNPNFMQRYTDAKTIDEFLINSGLFPENPDEITEEMFESEEFNEYVKQHTQFNSWSEMLSKAGEEWVIRQLGL